MGKNFKSKFSLKRLIYNDKYLIVISILLAVLVWTVLSINIGSDESKTIKVEVPISLGDEIADQYGLQYYTSQDTVELKVTITGAKYVVGQVTEDDLQINYDTSNITKTGEHSIPILVTNSSKNLDFDVSSISPSSIDAYFDVPKSKTFSLNLHYDETNVADGYVFGEPILSVDKVIVSGPQTYVNKIERTLVDVDFGDETDLTEPYTADCDIEIEGTGIETNYLTITTRTDDETPISKVTATLTVLKKTSLPVTVDMEDQPFDIGDAVSISYSVDEINAGILDSADITEAVIGTVNFNQLTVGDNYFEFPVKNLQGITVLDDIKTVSVKVSVASTYTTDTLNLSKNDIQVEGIPDGYSAVVKSVDKTNITVVKPSDVDIDSDDLEIKVDVSEQNDDNTYPAQITIKSNNNAWVYGEYNAVVELTKK
jgi:hypothetical protein